MKGKVQVITEGREDALQTHFTYMNDSRTRRYLTKKYLRSVLRKFQHANIIDLYIKVGVKLRTCLLEETYLLKRGDIKGRRKLVKRVVQVLLELNVSVEKIGVDAYLCPGIFKALLCQWKRSLRIVNLMNDIEDAESRRNWYRELSRAKVEYSQK